MLLRLGPYTTLRRRRSRHGFCWIYGPNLVALAHEGIVAYFLGLEKSPSKKEAEDPVRMSSGHVNFCQKVFKQACMGPVEDNIINDLWEAADFEHLDVPLYCK